MTRYDSRITWWVGCGVLAVVIGLVGCMTAKIGGTVSDDTGSGLPGQTVTVRQYAAVSTTTTNADGQYSLAATANEPAKLVLQMGVQFLSVSPDNGTVVIDNVTSDTEINFVAVWLRKRLFGGCYLGDPLDNTTWVPLSGVTISASGTYPLTGSAFSAEVTTASDGRWEILAPTGINLSIQVRCAYPVEFMVLGGK